MNLFKCESLILIEKAMEWGDKIPLGILYKEEKSDFHDKTSFLKDGKALVYRKFDLNKISNFMKDFE